MLLSLVWLLVAFVVGGLSGASIVWALRIRPRRWKVQAGSSSASADIQSSSDASPEAVNFVRDASMQIVNALGKLQSLMHEERSDREVFLQIIERRSQEMLNLLGQAVYWLETEARQRQELQQGTTLDANQGVLATSDRVAVGSASGPEPHHRNAMSVIREARVSSGGPLTDIIAENFARIDLETGRRFEDFRKSFLRLLGDRVLDIKEEDGAVLFIEDKHAAQLWPWPNNTIQRRWRDFFQAAKGENAPVRLVEQPATLTSQSGRWVLRNKGAVRQ